MKINEMITEEMVRAIYPRERHGDYLLSIFPASIYFGNGEGEEDFIDFNEFLFGDAWDYFREKDWDIKIFDKKSDLGGHITVYKGEFVGYYHTLLVTNYPSRLHAMAAAVAYMWEQEGKTNER